MNDNFVYVMSDGVDYKIGVSINPVQRALAISQELGKPISLLLSINCENAYGCESYLHHMYKDFNIKREWFKFSDRTFLTEVWNVCINNLIKNRNFIAVDSKLNQTDKDLEKLVQDNVALSYKFTSVCLDNKYSQVVLPAMLLALGCKKISRPEGVLYITPKGLEERVNKLRYKDMDAIANINTLK